MKKVLLSALLATLCSAASAGVVVGATGAVINHGGPGYGSLDDTYDQSGLYTPYISGVSDFATYVAAAPLHTFLFPDYEWFSAAGAARASVTYDLGVARSIAGMALWNEDFAGLGRFDLFGSLDGVNFSVLASAVNATDSANDEDYAAQVFAFTPASMRYVRLDLGACPQGADGVAYCSIGEVAFDSSSASATDVPEPASLGLLALGLLGLSAARKKAGARRAS